MCNLVTIVPKKTLPGDSFICRYKTLVVFLERVSITASEKYNIKDKNNTVLGIIEYTDGQVTLHIQNSYDRPPLIYNIFQDSINPTKCFTNNTIKNNYIWFEI